MMKKINNHLYLIKVESMNFSRNDHHDIIITFYGS